jgi:hypothetical protein
MIVPRSLRCASQRARRSGRDDIGLNGSDGIAQNLRRAQRRETQAPGTESCLGQPVTLERQSPPFAEKREGWGTLKYVVGRTNIRNGEVCGA